MKLSCLHSWTWQHLPMADTFDMWSLNHNKMNQKSCEWICCDDGIAATAVPTKIPEKRTEHNSRDRLYKAILDLRSEKKLSFPSDEVGHSGINLVKSLQECLWYIDGRHSVFAQQLCPIPAVFLQFVNYNNSEKSKHRKHPFGNMQCDVLSRIHWLLFSLLQASFWQQESTTQCSGLVRVPCRCGLTSLEHCVVLWLPECAMQENETCTSVSHTDKNPCWLHVCEVC